MEATALPARLRRLRIDRATAISVVAVSLKKALLVLGYYARPDVTPTLVPVYPFVWIDAAVLAVLTTSPPTSTRRRRLAGLTVAGGYLLLLSYLGGLVAPGSGMVPLQVNWALPTGYSPMLLYDGPLLHLALMPYAVVGYAALSYLVYVTVMDAAGAALSGVIGLFSCVSCTWPIVAMVAASVFGGGSAVAAAVAGQSLGLSTAVFLSALALLWWRPSLGGGGGSGVD